MASAVIGAVDSKNPLAGVPSPSHEKSEKQASGSGLGQDSAYAKEEGSALSVLEHMHNHRRLTARQISFLAIAGTIGASLRDSACSHMTG